MLLAALGTASGYISVLVLAFYIQHPQVALLYRRPERLWLLCPLLLYWISRMWLAGYRGRMTGHGFRGVASTILHEQGWPHAHIELQLAHQERDAVSASYNHALYLKPRAEMMQAWADYLDLLRKETDASADSLAA